MLTEALIFALKKRGVSGCSVTEAFPKSVAPFLSLELLIWELLSQV